MPADFTPDLAREPHDADDQAPAGGVDQVPPQAPSTGPSIAPSRADLPARRVSAGQPRQNRAPGTFDHPSKTVSYMAGYPLCWSWGVDGGDGSFRTDCGRSRSR
ncbi:hypothetical protein GCM10010446_68240 [Streptomyces enissocaesilis]|uniref:Uncharacterized protein n=1 Tax=Streptomyces enissocaesilis TaxID=332589 RepID=A0ABN3XQ90_9ACTN